MTTAQQWFADITADVIISGLIVCALVLLGVFTARVIIRTRKGVRR